MSFQSPGFDQVAGFEPQELHGKMGFDFVPPDDLAKVTEAFVDIVQQPGGTAEIRFKHGDGTWHHA